MKKTTITFEYENDDGELVEKELPAKWEVCWDCNGDGMVPNRRLSPHGDGSYTMSEFFDEYPEPEDRERYFSGGYDEPCPTCCGRTTVKEIDWKLLEERDPELAKKYEQHLNDEAYYASMCEAERRMGC